MKSGKTLLFLAFILMLAYPMITASYVYFEAHYIPYQKFLLRMALLITLCVLAYYKHNWARFVLCGISIVAVIGAITGIAMHFYKHQASPLEPLLYVQLIEYAAVSLLLLWPSSVRDFFQKK